MVRTVKTGTGCLASHLVKMRLLRGGLGKGNKGGRGRRSPMENSNVVFLRAGRAPALNKLEWP